MTERTPLVAMLEARSVAVVGASPRPGSFGEQMMVQLTGGGFDGAIYPVNPSYEEVMGHRCYPSLETVPEPVDLTLLGVANKLLEGQLTAAAAAGSRSAVIFASCYEEPAPGVRPLTERLSAIARASNMALCGGNGMGFINVERNLRACGFFEPGDLRAGSIAFISHSGSAFSAVLHNRRGLRFNVVVSSGLELVTTMAEYLDHVLGLPSIRAVGLFMETVRDPAGLRAALSKADELEIPVVALKVGREAQAKELVMAHSGALAGEDGAYEALFDAHGVLRVRGMDEMADTLELLVAGRTAGQGGLAAIHDSGGERAHLIDAAAEAGVELTQISEETRARLAAVLEPGLPPVNPLDAWGTGNQSEEIFIECMHALLEDPGTAALAFSVDLTTELVPESGYSRVANEVFAKTDKPVAVLANMSSAIDPRDAGYVRRAGIPVLEGTATGLAAFAHLFALRDHRGLPPLEAVAGAPTSIRDRWRRRLALGKSIAEGEALALLSDYGIPVVRAEPAANVEDALSAAELVGWPVAVKTSVQGALHKSDVRGVVLGVAGPAQLEAAYADLAARLGPEVLVEAMAPPGVELALGLVNDPQFGPLVMIAAGGLLIEVLKDRRFALPPLDPTRARRMLDRLAARPLLDGVRGQPAADLDAVAATIVRLSVLAQDLGDRIDALDVNPLIAGPDGCVAADALVIPA
jgi:acyl-CoA synthetase (NDP forming)